MARGFLISFVWGPGAGWGIFWKEAEGADCRDGSMAITLPALLMEWSFGGSRLFVTQNAQRQLLSSGNGFNCRSQYS